MGLPRHTFLFATWMFIGNAARCAAQATRATPCTSPQAASGASASRFILFITVLGLGLPWAWVAMCVDLFFRGLLAFLRYRTGKWKAVEV